MRLLPNINLSNDLSLSERERYILLGAFHALATGWALLAQANGEMIENAQAYFRTYHAEGDDSSLKAIDACRVAFATESKQEAYVLNSLDAALRASHSAAFGKSAFGANNNGGRWTNPSWSEILQDIDLFDAGESFSAVAGKRLYSMGLTNRGGGALSSAPLGALPDDDLIEWDRRKRLLLSDSASWVVWTDWYEERIQGVVNKPKFNWALAQLTELDWKQTPIAVNAKILSLLEDFDSQIPAATMTSASMAGPMSVFASDRLVSVRHNQEPFEQLEKSLDQILSEFSRDHNKQEFKALQTRNLIEVIDETRTQLNSGLVSLNLLRDKLRPEIKKLAEDCKNYGIIGGTIYLAAKVAYDVINYILGIFGIS